MKKTYLLWSGVKGALATTTALSVALSIISNPAHAGDKDTKEVVPPPPVCSKINWLLNVEFANEYVTPRGMIVRDKGLTIQPLLLAFVPLYKGDGFINGVKLFGGAWNDFGTSSVSKHPPYGSKPTTNWTEIDPIAGFSVGFAKNFTFDATWSAFAEQILDIGTSHNLELKVSMDDSPYLGAFALHPSFAYWQELEGKATDADVPFAVFGPSPRSGGNPQPGPSYYLDAAIDPSYTFKDVLGGLKLEAPCSVLLPNKRFYGEYFGKASTVGLIDVGAKATVPLTFMPEGYGHWSFHTGVKYQYYVDKNLYNLNIFNAPGKPTRETWQVYAGITAFF